MWKEDREEKEIIDWEIIHCAEFKQNRIKVAVHFYFYYFFDSLPKNDLLYSWMIINIYKKMKLLLFFTLNITVDLKV